MQASDIVFDAHGLVPCVVQEWGTGEVLMLAYMNLEALEKTLESGYTWFWSRSRAGLWNKGETSGHVQRVRELRYDCDADALLALVEQIGPACHTGDHSCFDGRLLSDGARTGPLFQTLADLYGTIVGRKASPPESSYTARLFEGGVTAIGAKVEEEAAEVVEAAAEGDVPHSVYEAGDLLYHLLVLLAQLDIPLVDVWTELERRKG
ncbi:MAG: bifunctional phosphoribosyl-AMP cyclohydrolase/phosphoribosyl-ATP diphosphatase HisIE [Thermoleophilia bacterium]